MPGVHSVSNTLCDIFVYLLAPNLSLSLKVFFWFGASLWTLDRSGMSLILCFLANLFEVYKTLAKTMY